MKKNILLRTNTLICIVIVVGFLFTAILSYRANYSTSLENIVQVSNLASEGIYYQMNSIFTKPVNVSLTMANDSLLKELLSQETEHLADSEYMKTIQEYLSTYQKEYNYDSVFLVSTGTGRYYNFNGFDRVLTKDNSENEWYYKFLSSNDSYNMNVDNDEVAGAQNEITVFVNCKIKNDDGAVIGVVGVGMCTNYLQEMLKQYQEEFDVNAYLINADGTIAVSVDYTGYEKISLYDIGLYNDKVIDGIIDWKKQGAANGLWVNGIDGTEKKDYIVTRYLPELEWHLVVERDTGALMQSFIRQLAVTIVIIIAIVVLILVIITRVINSFNQRIVSLAQSVEQERRTVFEKVTEELFDKIYELDITNNCPANKATEQYFVSMGVPEGTPYDRALRIITQRQIKEEFREGYIETFRPENVLRAYEAGQDTLCYDFMILNEAQEYCWMRIIARIVQWESDKSIHMLTYRQNIDIEKKQEKKMLKLVQTDEMTGLLTKTATRRQIEARLEAEAGGIFAFFIFDIDCFKQANDIFGHAFGDSIIVTFAHTIQKHFRKEDILGRIGGDEFAAFMAVNDEDEALKKAEELLRVLTQEYSLNGKHWEITTSIGIAVARGGDFDSFYQNADAALYVVKKNGRKGYTLYTEEMAE